MFSPPSVFWWDRWLEYIAQRGNKYENKSANQPRNLACQNKSQKWIIILLANRDSDIIEGLFTKWDCMLVYKGPFID